jgi:quinoprotein glucose dehydrogenase
VGETLPASPGDIRGWDVRTGKRLWTFHTIPHPGEPGAETWPKDAYLKEGGANAWTGVIVDEKNGIVFAGTGEAAEDFWGGTRPGDNLYGDSLIAIDAATGKRLWHFQAIHHGGWDDDFAAPPALITVTHNGRKVDAVTATNKQGFIYLFDRKTGQSLFPIDEVKTPPSNVPGERLSPTQPVPRLPYPIARQTLTSDDLTQISPEANAYARAKLATMKDAPVPFTPIEYKKDTIAVPGFSGGVEWGGVSTDPNGILYANSEDVAWYTSVIDQPKPTPDRPEKTFSGYHKFVDKDGYPAVSTPWGTLNAIDMNTGQYLWRIPFGEYPDLVAKGVRNTGSESYGGPVTTASGLLFIGATIYDRKFHAYDSATGKLLWEAQLPYAGVATPATYMVDGRQYVVIAASGNRDRKSPQGAAYIAFALPQ